MVIRGEGDRSVEANVTEKVGSRIESGWPLRCHWWQSEGLFVAAERDAPTICS